MLDDSEKLEPFADINLEKMSSDLINFLRKELNSESIDYLVPLTRLTGGQETFICRFQLSGVEENLSRPLILRVFAEHSSQFQPDMENTVHNVMADLGFPVPVVHGTCTDKTVLGNAFLIMDFSEGDTLLESGLPFDQIFKILGTLHAKMHNIDSEPIVQKILEVGWDIESISFDGRLEWYRTQVNLNFPWLSDAVQWLAKNRPSDPEVLRICHCDFHPINILFKDNKVQAVLDWGGFLLADPALDVAITSWLSTVAAKALLPDLDFEQLRETYLNAYREIRPLDETNITYYRVFRSVMDMISGAQGQAIMAHPEIVQLQLNSIYEVTGIKIRVPT